jgi:hypothetical protein
VRSEASFPAERGAVDDSRKLQGRCAALDLTGLYAKGNLLFAIAFCSRP